MASSFSTTSSGSTTVSVVSKTQSQFPEYSNSPNSRVSFRLSQKPNLRFFAKGMRGIYTVDKAQLKKVGFNGPLNASAKSEVPAVEDKDGDSSKETSPTALATEESISEFITQVLTLVKLVDSRDIVELQLKQIDCELVIRKKEALPQSQTPTQVVMMQPPSQPSFMPSPPTPTPASAPSSAASTRSTPASAPSATPPPPAKSSLPTIKCPMAGTFYRSPGPAEPPFVKVGDKVQKGQVLCIIEAMKLMNEIEADQSGTIVDILAEDGKPVSVDIPLFVIQP